MVTGILRPASLRRTYLPRPCHARPFAACCLPPRGPPHAVPVLFTPRDGVLHQSYDIARWSDNHSARPGAERLFPEGREPEIRRWVPGAYG